MSFAHHTIFILIQHLAEGTRPSSTNLIKYLLTQGKFSKVYHFSHLLTKLLYIIGVGDPSFLDQLA
jgi:hypothetical protein